MNILLNNFALIFSVTVALSLLGWFIIAPFAGSRPFLSLAAPWAGLVMVTFVSLFYYVMLKLPLVQAAVLASVSCLLLSATLFWINEKPIFSRSGVAKWFIAVAVLCLIEAVINTYMWQRIGGPALFYYDGTDHAGWAWTADWMRYFTILQRPVDPMTAEMDAYQWIPYFHFTIDPRFGTFMALSLMSAVSGLQGMFAYDLICGLGLVVGILGLIGVFCRTYWFSILLAIGLITCHWFDYGKTGYLGKLIDYPSIFIVVGFLLLTFRAPAAQRRFALTAMVLLIIAVSHMYAGPVLGLFAMLLGSIFIACHLWFERAVLNAAGRHQLLLSSRDELMFLSLCVLLAIVASGIIARPLALGYSHYGLPWSYVLTRIADIEHQGAHLTRFTDPQLTGLTWLMGGLWVIALVASLRARCAEAVALIVGPMLLLAALYVFDARDIAFQLIGTFYPLGLLGYVLVCERLGTRPTKPAARWNVGIVASSALLLFAIALHVPRFLGALDRFEGPTTPVMYEFSKAELDGLRNAIGSVPTMIDVVEAPQLPMALVVGLGPQIKFQWSERAWIFFSGCRPKVDSCSHRPPESVPPGYRIVAVGTPVDADRVVFRTRQFLLVKEIPGTASAPSQWNP